MRRDSTSRYAAEDVGVCDPLTMLAPRRIGMGTTWTGWHNLSSSRFTSVTTRVSHSPTIL